MAAPEHVEEIYNRHERRRPFIYDDVVLGLERSQKETKGGKGLCGCRSKLGLFLCFHICMHHHLFGSIQTKSNRIESYRTVVSPPTSPYARSSPSFLSAYTPQSVFLYNALPHPHSQLINHPIPTHQYNTPNPTQSPLPRLADQLIRHALHPLPRHRRGRVERRQIHPREALRNRGGGGRRGRRGVVMPVAALCVCAPCLFVGERVRVR